MGYAQAAGLPAISGLYATIVPLVAYAIFGPSRVLVLAPDSSLAALIAATVLPLAAGNADRAISLAGALAILSGALCIVAGLSRFGFVTELLSKPIRYGYMNGIVLTVLIGQLPAVLGFSVSGEDTLQRAIGLVSGILEGRINWTAAAVSLSCLVVILACKRWTTRLPGVLIAVGGATVVVWLLALDERAGLSVIGPLPQGLPDFHPPKVSVTELRLLFSGALAIALVSFADMSVLSRTYAQRGGYNVDANQEFIALGAANVTAGLFQGFPVSCSSSRTPVAESAGAKSQVAGIVGAFCIALLLIFAPTLLNKLPHAALGAVVISACIGLMEIAGVLRLYRLRPSELAFSVVCFLGVILFGVIHGIFLSVALALLAFIWRAWRPYDAVLGRVDGLKGYHDISRHPDAKQIPGLVLFRWDAPLFFANASVFQEHVLQAVADSPTPTKWIVVAAEPVTDIDITAADMLAELDQRLHQSGVELCFAEMKGPVKDRLKRYGLFASFGTESFFPTIGRAVDEFVAKHHVEWRDWEERV
jgi:high affinity sulfate transporter 1